MTISGRVDNQMWGHNPVAALPFLRKGKFIEVAVYGILATTINPSTATPRYLVYFDRIDNPIK
jgi:hypothetical protein